MNARSYLFRPLQVHLLVVEEDVRSEYFEYARLFHPAQEEDLIHGDTPFSE